jgi:hypothetical protein
MDIGNIMSGKLKEVTGKYGNIVIVAPPGIADKVEKISDTPLKRYNLEHKGVAILTLLGTQSMTKEIEPKGRNG